MIVKVCVFFILKKMFKLLKVNLLLDMLCVYLLEFILYRLKGMFKYWIFGIVVKCLNKNLLGFIFFVLWIVDIYVSIIKSINLF